MPGSTNSSACTAWASRSTRRSSAGDARPPLPHLRAGRHARDAAGLSGAAAAGERRQHLVRQPDRRPEGAGRRPGRRSGGRRAAMHAARRAASEDRAAARRCSAVARAIRPASTSATSSSSPRSAAALSTASKHRQRAPPARPKPRRAPVRNPADHRDVVGHVTEADAADVDAALPAPPTPHRVAGDAAGRARRLPAPRRRSAGARGPR